MSDDDETELTQRLIKTGLFAWYMPPGAPILVVPDVVSSSLTEEADMFCATNVVFSARRK